MNYVLFDYTFSLVPLEVQTWFVHDEPLNTRTTCIIIRHRDKIILFICYIVVLALVESNDAIALI